MSAALVRRVTRMVEARAERRRELVADAMAAAGIGDVRVEGELVRLTGRGIGRRWLNDLALREAGRAGR